MATISEALAIAVQHHQSGRLQAAAQIYRQILAVQPDHANALHLLGVTAAQSGNHAEAVQLIERAIQVQGNAAAFYSNLGGAYQALHRTSAAVAAYRRALELDPNFADAYSNLGLAYKDQGKLDEAVACFRRALELNPRFAEAHNNLGVVRRDQGQLDEAAACYRRALEWKPNYAEAHNNLGIVLKDQGKPEEAVACCRRALELNPAYCDAFNNLGNALKEQGKIDEAVASYRRALALNPNFAEALNNLGVALKDQGKLDETIAACRRALELKPDFVDARMNLGVAFKERGNFDDAIACFRRALELKPDYAGAHYNLGTAWEEKGDLQAAETSYRAAVRCDPRFAFAHHKLAKLLGGRLPEQDLAAQRRLLEQDSTSNGQGVLTDVQRLFLHFGLADVLDARGDYAAAAAHLARGNALQLAEWRKHGQGYDPQEYERVVTQMIAACGPELFARASDFGLESELPVFIVGLPRSGTTLIEQILASHSQVFGAGEINLAGETMAALGGQAAECIENLRRLDRDTAQRLAARHLERLRAFDPAALRIVDKMPDNYLLLGMLAVLFPRAKFIHCRRDLRDVAVSCWLTRFQDIRWANDPQHIAARFRDYQRVMAHWRQVLPVRVLEVDYEETVADLESVARKLVAWCGLAWEPRCLEFHRAQRPVKTASAIQVRQPVFGTSVGRWQHYEQALAPLLAAVGGGIPEGTPNCADTMERNASPQPWVYGVRPRGISESVPGHA